MYEKRAFNRAEQDLSRKLRTEMEALEKRIEEIGPCRERSLALTKLDEALLWANAAIAAGGIERLRAPVDVKPKQEETDMQIAIADTIQRGILGNKPKLNEDDVNLDVVEMLRKNIDAACDQFANECNTMNARIGLWRAILADMEKGGQNG